MVYGAFSKLIGYNKDSGVKVEVLAKIIWWPVCVWFDDPFVFNN